MGLFRRLDHYSSFRRIALAQWAPPKNGLIYGSMNLDVTEAEPFLKGLEERHGQSVSFGTLVGKAIAIALHAMPELNARVIGRKIWVKEDIDVYYQVDVGEGGDLAGAVVRNADRKSLPAIAAELGKRAKKIRTGKDEQYEKAQKRGLVGRAPIWLLSWILSLFSFLLFRLGLPARWLGGTDPDPFGSVMVTNVGGFGINLGFAPLVPWTRVPMVVVVGTAVDSPAVVDGRLCVRKLLPTSVTIDHRLMDGAHIGKLAAIARSFVEHPNEQGTVEWKGTKYGHPVPEDEWGPPARSVPPPTV